nr:hypothetical protein HUO10_001275 [Paraburkholderia busanensis]
MVATWAVYTCAASHLGVVKAIPLTFAVAALLALRAASYVRGQPQALKIGVDGLAVWDRTGALSAEGRITASAHWSDRLLALTLTPERGRKHTLLLAADALPREVFRKLSVLGRRAVGA